MAGYLSQIILLSICACFNIAFLLLNFYLPVSDFFLGICLIAISFVQYAEEICISIKGTSLSNYYREVDPSEAGSSDVSDSLSEGSSISSIGLGLMKKR
ncbi:MAG: hypothetical protein Ct9H300mP28_34800 [Pseudomonadota bacterium]|nr:MAG: hypothetical protein Ct9H300mP28_34800 [Pseudomonadota bacterium]